MKLVWRSLFFCSFSLATLVSLVPLASVKAQIEPDNTLGTQNSQVTPDNINGVDSDRIDGGVTRGSNLFHSFREFNVGEGRGAYFSNPDGIANIFSRVTGGNPSRILGRLGVLGNANLFFINPNGISFGPNARLDLRGGSFFASTADSVVFDNNFEFSASNPTAPLLTVNIPTGLRFRDNPGGITTNRSVASNGSVLSSFLQVQPGRTLALVGGNVSLDGGILSAPGGRIELGGLSAAGTVGINNDGSLSFPDGVTRGNVSLANGAVINVIAGRQGGGNININAQNIRISELSLLIAGLAPNLGTVDTQAGNITLNATGETRIDRSTIENNVNRGTTANNSDIRITTGSFVLTNGANLITTNFGSSELDIDNPRVAGDIIVDASEQITIDGEANIFSNGFFGRVFLTSTNASININNSLIETTSNNSIADSENNRFSLINITAPQGSVFLDGAKLKASNSSTGFAGDIVLNARDQISIKDSKIFVQGNQGRIVIGDANSFLPALLRIDGTITDTSTSTTLSTSNRTAPSRNAGPIQIAAGKVVINQAEIVSDTYGFGKAGNISVNASGFVELVGSTLFTNVRAGAQNGQAGDITINAGSLSMLDGAQLQSGVVGSSQQTPQGGQGNGGNVKIDIQGDVRIAGRNQRGKTSGIFNDVEQGGSGNAGNITINAGSIFLTDEAELRTKNNSDGLAGDIVLNARNNIEITNSEINSTSNYNIIDPDLFSLIKITAQEGSIFLDRQSTIRASNSSIGYAGDIVLNARDRVSINNSTIETEGNFGRILIGKGREDFYPEQTTSPREISLNGSTLSTTNASVNVEDFPDTQIDAGDISIDAIESVSLKSDSEIIFDTERLGNAGNIFLTTNGIVEFDNSRLFSNIEDGGIGRAGDITIKAGSLSLLNGSQIQSGINPGGQGNDISRVTIDVQGDVRITGRSPTNGKASAIFTDVGARASGDASSITLTSQRGSLVLDGGRLYSANDSDSGGKAGNIKVTTAKDIRLDNQALINADTRGGQGNITLRSRDLILRRNSNIRTNAQGDATGGNIRIRTGNLLAFPRENSDITANAEESFGGRVSIAADGIFGIRFREQLTSESDITASSALGADFSGTVNLNTPDVDPSRGLIELPENVIDPSTQIAQNPCQRGVGSEFTVTGRGGLPPSPNQTLSSDSVRVGLVAPVPSTANTAATNATSSPEGSTASKILPAQGWVFNNKGEVMLTAYDPTNSSVRGSRYNPATCVAK